MQQEEVPPLPILMVSSPPPLASATPADITLPAPLCPQQDRKLRAEAHLSGSPLTPAPKAAPTSASLFPKYWLSERLSH